MRTKRLTLQLSEYFASMVSTKTWIQQQDLAKFCSNESPSVLLSTYSSTLGGQGTSTRRLRFDLAKACFNGVMYEGGQDSLPTFSRSPAQNSRQRILTLGTLSRDEESSS